MKTYNIISLVIVLSLLSFVTLAQSSGPKRPVSKEIQKIANQNFLSSGDILTVASVGYPVWTISKCVQLSSNDLERIVTPGNIVSEGYPAWIISKGIHRKAVRIKEQPKKSFDKDVIAGIQDIIW